MFIPYLRGGGHVLLIEPLVFLQMYPFRPAHIPPTSNLAHIFRPAHAMHFAVYELAKDLMGGNLGGGHHPAIAGAAAALATVVNEGIMTPADVVKQRLQV